MIRAYIEYIRKSFNYTADVNMKEAVTVFIFNFLIFFIVLSIGIFIPITWENILVDFLYSMMFLTVIPTISLMIRMIREIIKK